MAHLFAYDTLQQPAVQMATFGRQLAGEPDMLAGYALAPVDELAVRANGSVVHSTAYRTGNAAHRVAGFLYELDEAEVRAAADYVGDSMARCEVSLISGATGYMFVRAEMVSSARAA